jgi:hypothetical protein
MLTGLIILAEKAAVAAELPEAPKVSTFAPAEDLASQLEAYVGEFQSVVKSESEYKEFATKLSKDANTVLLIALALGVHDTDNKYKQAAPALVDAAKTVMAAKDFQAAKAAVKAFEAAMTANANAAELSWNDTRDASMAELMKQVPLVNTKLKRYLRKFKEKAEATSGQTAVIAVIAQGSMPLTGQTEKPNEVELWYKRCAEMRDAAAAVNSAIHAQDENAAEKAMKDLATSCDDCHAVFSPKELKK